ncbi:MAG: lipid-A-disaccharide synthase [Limisphaerales bacterium]
MEPKTFMLIAGEPSGDLLAAELVSALREKLPDTKFFGAGGPKMTAAGVDLAFDLTQHAVTGISDVLKNYFKFRRLFNQLLALAIERKPGVVIGVDFGGFNLRFGHAVKEYVRHHPEANWDPKIIQLVSPQVWASRPNRANLLAADYDLLLSIFPFEKAWYAGRVPRLRVEFIGHPMLDRIRKSETGNRKPKESPILLLLPGSRRSELQKHLPVMIPAAKLIRAKVPDAKIKMVAPNKELARLAASLGVNFSIQIGSLPNALAQTDVAIASTGTVTMECAFFGVPAVTLYKTSWLTYEIGRRIVTVNSLTMPNLLAGEEVYPEFIQGAATPQHIANAALDLLQNQTHRQKIESLLKKIVFSLGEPGAAKRAATAILSLFP